MVSTYFIGDIHKVIKDIDDESIDLILTNPPFGTTNKEWDKGLDWDFLFPEMFRILKSNGVICLHASIPFTYELIKIKKPKYHYTWIKARPTGHLNAKKQPLRNVEEVLVYYKNPKHTYNPQMKGDTIKKEKRENKNYSEYYKYQKSYESTHKGDYPRLFLGAFNSVSQKDSPKSVPDTITNYLINTYSNANETILDMTCCDTHNGKLANKLNRDYFGVDISNKYLKGEVSP